MTEKIRDKLTKKRPHERAHRSIHMLHDRLISLGRSRHWLSRESNVSHPTLWKYWEGLAMPKATTLDRLMEKVGMEAHYRVRDVI